MALSASTVFEVRTAGSDTNGGAFKTGATGTDYSLQDSKNTVGSNISTVDAVANGTTTITSATAAFTTAITGNIIYLAGGSGTLTGGWYEATYVSATSFTTDRSVAAGTGITLNIGGALASPGTAGALMVAGNDLYIKAGTYSITSASTNVAAGCLSLPAGTASNATRVIGYQTTRGDGGTKPILQASGISTFVLITCGNGNHIENISVDGAGLTSSKGISAALNVRFYRCKAANCTNSGFVGAISTAFVVSCEATNCSTQAAYLTCFCVGCTAHDNTITGYSGCYAINCIAANNSGASSDGFATGGSTVSLFNCTSYNNGRHGFNFTANNFSTTVQNCLAENNAGYGFTATAAFDNLNLYNCAGYNNTSNLVQTAVIATGQQVGLITCTAEIFVNAAVGNFALNSMSNGGGACRAAGILGAFPGLSTTGYADVGAVQHADPAQVRGRRWINV